MLLGPGLLVQEGHIFKSHFRLFKDEALLFNSFFCHLSVLYHGERTRTGTTGLAPLRREQKPARRMGSLFSLILSLSTMATTTRAARD